MNCEHCKYFDKFAEHETNGMCRHYSPRLTAGIIEGNRNMTNPYKAAWPEVRTDDWCGEFAWIVK